jgi:uncharacterized protein (DUF427 family)
MTTTREPKILGPEHPITIEPAGVRVVARVGAQTVADTTRALTMREASYPPAHYIPLWTHNPPITSQASTVNAGLRSPAEDGDLRCGQSG